jgi:MYXO-CTERM domain-containing protein
MTAGSLLALDAPAQAQDIRNSHVTAIADGDNCGRTNRDENGRDRKGDNFQACAEHATLAQLADPKQIVMFRLASKDVLNGVDIFDRAQLACTSLTLTPTGPVVNIDKYVTHNDGHEYRNAHASYAVPIDGGKAVAVFYNYRPNNNTERYAQVFDANCNSLSAQTRVMQKNNDDVCASLENDSHLVTGDSDGYTTVAATCGGNGNGRDDGWVYQTEFVRQPDGTYDIDKQWDVRVEPEEERTRMTATYIPELEMLGVCGSAGNSQPSNRGVRCYGVHTGAGENGAEAQSRLLWRQYVAKRDDRIYQTQIKTAASITDPSEVTATWQTLVKRNRREKGAATLNTVRLKFSREGLDIVALPVQKIAPGFDATHRAMLAVPWGVDGQERDAVMLMSTSVNGSPNATATVQIFSWDAVQRQFVRHRQLGINSAIDNAWISNIYGNNPHTQGRNHIQSRVFTNPYYGDPTGFMPKVKTFLATAATPRKMREGTDIAQDKLAFELVLTPAVVAPEAEPEPEPETPVDPTEPDSTEPTDPNDPNTPTDPTDPTDPSTSGSTVGACSASGSTGAGAGFLALLGLALFGSTRRRRR